MKTYKVVVSAALLLLVSMLVSAVPESSTPQKKYISQYAETAVREMYRSGVPASITLAQGLLESRYGQSPLAKEGNNHFGIKCHDWTGKKMYHDDDKRGECFRVYKSADESFRDHSDFLRYRDRYKSLFDNEITDYKAWAYGLKKAGYATDPAYPAKLIKIIEDYHLYDYDTMKPESFGEGGTVTETVSGNAAGQKPDTHKKKSSRKHKRSEVKEEKIPVSPLRLEEPKREVTGKAAEEFSFSLTRQLFSKNGVPFIYALEGESYSSIASDYHLFTREILRFNDAAADEALAPGTIVYLQAKKVRTERGLDKYISDEGGESLRALSQRFAVRLKSLCKLNGLDADYVTVSGDELRLR